MNLHRDKWMQLVLDETTLSPDAKATAEVIAGSVGIGRIGFTNWQKVNRLLSRPSTDAAVHGHLRELKECGFLGRYMGNRFHQSRGWPLLIPGEEVEGD